MVRCRKIARRSAVGMQFKPTVPTHKPATRTAVGAGGVPTAATGVRGMARVTRNHRATPFFGFLHGKGFQLRERPAVNTALGLGLAARLHALADVGQVLNHTCRARFNRRNELLTQDVIVVPAQARLFPAETFPVPLGRLGALLVQRPCQVAQRRFGCFLGPLPHELIGAQHRGPHNPQGNPNHRIGWRNLRRSHGDTTVQPPAPVAEQPIGRSRVVRIFVV